MSFFRRSIRVVVVSLLLPGGAVSAAPRLEVVATLPSYASIAGLIGGDRVVARSISRSDEDAHFVKPKPSLALMLRRANLFITTGLDLELWAPTLVDKSGNREIRDGAAGYVAASHGVNMQDVPESVSRAAGDVHIYGNPHIHTSPINAKAIAGNIAGALIRVDPGGAEVYRRNLEAFRRRIDDALYGEALVELLGPEVLDALAVKGELISFLEGRSYEGRPLLDRLGGWLGRGMVFRGKKIIAYHRNWIYFTTLVGLDVVDYVEPKPGIPPSPRHVLQLIDEIRDQQIRVLLSASYFDASKARAIAERTGCTVVRVPLEPNLDEEDYFGMVDRWVDRLAGAFEAGG